MALLLMSSLKNDVIGVAKKILATQVLYMPVSTALFLLVTPLLEVLVGTVGRRGLFFARARPSKLATALRLP
uniref:Uncharacterized protein n=1 Tax=Chromera velia CCMP2878 TaxID=1169474 RepID=A0A0G4I843_9ALVE|eukprot:Cvel_11775.t1-p1 / transcript=Cvel_11775.t1 / gene=Cvel_11775 / organism=Chromera_velia_CCMP2878 / gene_product=hypothetical protein / transcript_product=hypothetical protein / location=Cvel_scaffold749:11967-14043(+) / protein_length=71 / sequence_SO=supercontig / SO=protein_coding / is_pseudo=false